MTFTEASWIDGVADAVAAGPKLTRSKEEFNIACDHVVRLLEDARLLLERRSYASAAFFAVTALEETSKVHVGLFRTGDEQERRRGYPLYDHGKKHLLAVGPTVEMGNRLTKAIGEQRASAVIGQARSGGLRVLREACLYVERSKDDLLVPHDRISKADARDLLLLAIEAFDDALVGFTHHSMDLGRRTDALFAAVAAEQAVATDNLAAGTSAQARGADSSAAADERQNDDRRMVGLASSSA